MLAQHYNTQTKAKVRHFWHPGNFPFSAAYTCQSLLPLPAETHSFASCGSSSHHRNGRINGAISYLLWCSSAESQKKTWTVPGTSRAAQEESSIACLTECTFGLFLVRNLLTLNHCSILSGPRFLRGIRMSVSAHLSSPAQTAKDRRAYPFKKPQRDCSVTSAPAESPTGFQYALATALPMSSAQSSPVELSCFEV